MGYKYFDTPQGEDVFKKLWVTTKLSGAAGLMVSIGDVMLYSHPKGYMPTIGRFIYLTGPIIGTAATFTVISNVAASIRKKDDRLNYFLGGVAAGQVVGAWRKSLMVGFVASLAFGVLGIVRKDSIDQEWDFSPKIVREYSGVNTRVYDFTLTAERPKDWTTGEK